MFEKLSNGDFEYWAAWASIIGLILTVIGLIISLRSTNNKVNNLTTEVESTNKNVNKIEAKLTSTSNSTSELKAEINSLNQQIVSMKSEIKLLQTTQQTVQVINYTPPAPFYTIPPFNPLMNPSGNPGVYPMENQNDF